MKKNQIITVAAVVAFVGLLLFINRHEPARVSEQQAKEAAEAKKLLEEAEGEKPTFKDQIQKRIEEMANAEKPGSNTVAPASTETAAAAPPYQVEFQCSNGTFIVEVHPEWAPIGAEQFRKVIEAGIYNEARFFRVVPGFVVQWGIPGDPEKAAEWEKRTIQDEAVTTSNVRGTITYAKSGAPNSRTSQVFINFGDNSNLDGMGFSPFGKVVKGMEVVDAIHSESREKPDQGEITNRGNAYLKEYFPKLDYIKEAKILGDVAVPAADAAPPTQEAAAPAPEPATTTQH